MTQPDHRHFIRQSFASWVLDHSPPDTHCVIPACSMDICALSRDDGGIWLFSIWIFSRRINFYGFSVEIKEGLDIYLKNLVKGEGAQWVVMNSPKREIIPTAVFREVPIMISGSSSNIRVIKPLMVKFGCIPSYGVYSRRWSTSWGWFYFGTLWW